MDMISCLTFDLAPLVKVKFSLVSVQIQQNIILDQ